MNGHADRAETGRVEAFSDGVFAIAITLLGFALKVPDVATTSLRAELVAGWPSYLAFTTSFVTISVVWINHHRVFSHIVRVDHALLLLNALLLMTVALVPFGTAVLANHFARASHARTATTLYGAIFVALTGAFDLMWRYAARRHRLLDRAADKPTIRRINRQYGFGPLLYLASLALAQWSPWASVAADLLLVVYFALPLVYWSRAVQSGIAPHASVAPRSGAHQE